MIYEVILNKFYLVYLDLSNIIFRLKQLKCESWHFNNMWKQLHDLLISVIGEVWAHTTSLGPPLFFIEVSLPRHEMSIIPSLRSNPA